MARPRVRLISRGMVDLLRDPGVEAELERRAEKVATEARATAPVASGAYRDGIKVWSENGSKRSTAHVGSTARHAPIVEAATGNMARSLDAAGGV